MNTRTPINIEGFTSHFADGRSWTPNAAGASSAMRTAR